MAKSYRCRGFVNGKSVTIRLDAESELDAIKKFHQQFITEGHDPSTVERIAVKEKAPPKSARLFFGKDRNAPAVDPAANEEAPKVTSKPKAAAKKGKK